MKRILYYESPVGPLGIVEENSKIIEVILNCHEKVKEFTEEKSEILAMAEQQLDEYFLGKRKKFQLPLEARGTEFQKKVWKALSEIPYGKVASYKDVAKAIGNEKACRAVGMANNKNPISIFIPCHRVIGVNGKLVGYGGGLSIKEFLLNLEKNNK